MRAFFVWLLGFVGLEIVLFSGTAMIDLEWTANNSVFLFAVGVVLLMAAWAAQRRPLIADWLAGKKESFHPENALLNPHILRADYRGPLDGQTVGLLILWVAVVNVGSRATTIHATGVHITFEEDGRILQGDSKKLRVVHPPNGIKYDDLMYSPDQAIYEAGAKKIKAEGGRIVGFIAAEIAPKLFERLIAESGRVVFVTEDAYGMDRAGWISVTGRESGIKMQYIAGLQPEREIENYQPLESPTEGKN